MAAWADKNERFVEIPGIVEIRWVSDDPDYYVAPIDLFDEQSKGLPDYYGKKDKTTTEQAFFTCNICECELKSVVTLRAHCKGTQHIRKALNKKKEYRKSQKSVKKEENPDASAERNYHFDTLFEWLDQGTSEAVVGIEYVTEFRSGNKNDIPYYHCELSFCKDAQGNAESMKNHLLSLRHKQAFLEMKTGSFLKHQAEVSQRVAEFTKDYQRDFTKMREIVDRRKWSMVRDLDYRGSGERSGVKREREYDRDDYEHRGRDIKSEKRFYQDQTSSRESSNRRGYDRNDYDYRDRSFKTESYQDFQSSSRDSLNQYRDSYSRNVDVDRHRSLQRESRENDARYPSESRHSDEDVEEIGRNGNFENWKTAQIKVDKDADRASTSVQNSREISTSSKSSSNADEIDRLHRKVAEKVMKVMNKYYPGADEFDRSLYKIGSPEEYSKLAKQLSHKLRNQIKESYEAYHGTLDGILLTPDHVQSIKTEVDSYLEQMPTLMS